MIVLPFDVSKLFYQAGGEAVKRMSGSNRTAIGIVQTAGVGVVWRDPNPM
jgi:hypothetical protein